MVVVTRGTEERSSTTSRAPYLLALGAFAMVTGMELGAWHFGFAGPTSHLLHDFVFGPKHGPVIWAALALSTVGLTKPERIRVLGLAAAIDVVFFAGRLVAGTRPTYGNGGLIMLVAVALWAAVRWTGKRRFDALKGVVLGMTLVMATKMSDAWLLITAKTQHHVLDQYVAVSDRALGDPSWVMGRIVDASGSVGHLILQTVYIELPVAAMFVAAFQLRRGWTPHHIVRTFIGIGVVGPLCYVLFPVVGPIFAYGSLGKGFALSHIWPNVTASHLNPVSFGFDQLTPRNCMPSLHTAWAVTIYIHTRRTNRWVEGFGTVWLVCTLMATLGFGYHYGVDLIAGGVFALTVESALREPERGWGLWRIRLVGGGALALTGLLLSYRFLAVEIAEFSLVTGPLLLAVVACMAMSFHATFFAPEGESVMDRAAERLLGTTTAATS